MGTLYIGYLKGKCDYMIKPIELDLIKFNMVEYCDIENESYTYNNSKIYREVCVLVNCSFDEPYISGKMINDFIYLRFNDYFVEKHMMNQNSQIKTTIQNYKNRHTRMLYNESKKKINE